MQSSEMKLVVYVDVDDTLVRSFGTKRIPISAAVEHVKALKHAGAELYCWSTGGAEYARASARDLGIDDCFVAFLPKPHVLLDDQHPQEWRRLLHVHPMQAGERSLSDYVAAITA
jgi:phosphoserine phosphatase